MFVYRGLSKRLSPIPFTDEHYNNMNFIDKLLRRKPEMVQYGSRSGKAKAYAYIDPKTGEKKMKIEGEKYDLRGVPRHHLLHGPMAPLKRYIKNMIIEQMVKCLPHKIPDDQLIIPVRELARVFDLWIEAEDEPEMKRLAGQLKDPICMILQEDDAWLWRFMWFLEQLDMNKMKLTKADKYYFRGKSFNSEYIK